MSLHTRGDLTIGKVAKVRSGAETTKAEIRRRVLDAVRAARQPAKVLDAFAGHGQMHAMVWKDADAYLGIDLDWWRDERFAYVGDNRRVMRAIDLYEHTIFDFDSFGPPWEQVYILVRRRPLRRGETIGIILTEGSGLALKAGAKPTAFYWFAGNVKNVAGGILIHDDMIDRAIDKMCRMLGARLVRRWQASNNSGGHMRYIGLVLEHDPKSERIPSG